MCCERGSASRSRTPKRCRWQRWSFGIPLATCVNCVRPGVSAPAVPLASDAVVVGQTVYALGAPAGLELTLSAGLVSALRLDDAERLTAIQTSAAISPGSSGGGLFDDQGRLIGITTAFIGGNTQNLNLALPVSMVRELPERHASAQAASESDLPIARNLPTHKTAVSGVVTEDDLRDLKGK